jgi:hypothetical protein
MTIKDFHFEWAGDVGGVMGLDEHPRGTTPYFGSYTYTAPAGGNPSKMDFYLDGVGGSPNGKGIAAGGKFEITIAAFTGVNAVTAMATFAGGRGTTAITQVVPEPSSILLLALGVVGVTQIRVYRQRSQKRGC